MAIEKTQAISLGSHVLGDSSRIVSFLTNDFGLIRCVAKGSRSKKSRFGHALEPLMLSSIVFYHRPHRDLFTLSQTDILCHFPQIRADLVKTAIANVSVDLCRRLLLPSQKETRLFSILERFLKDLEAADKPGNPVFLIRFFLDFCLILGFELHISVCSRCGKKENLHYFDPMEGVLVCTDCRKHPRLRPVSAAVAALLNSGSEELKMQSCSGTAFFSAFDLLLEFLSFHTDKEIRLASVRFLQSVL